MFVYQYKNKQNLQELHLVFVKNYFDIYYYLFNMEGNPIIEEEQKD